MLELDISIGQFFDRHYETLPEAEQAAFRKLLDEKDQDIIDWIYGKAEPEESDLKQIIAILIQHAADLS